jgi:hypothetical protein
MYRLVLIILFIFSTAWSNDEVKCLEKNSDPFSKILNMANIQSLQKATNATEEGLCEFKLAENENVKNQQQVNIMVQMGYVDNSINPNDPLSYDHKITSSIKEFMIGPVCNFSLNSDGSLSKRMGNGKIVNIKFRNNSEKNGIFSQIMSNDNYNFIQTGLDKTDYLVTIGHSRHGKGLDLYPLKKYQASKAIPIYSGRFIEQLPESIKGFGVLACDSNNYQFSKGGMDIASKKNIKLLGLEKKLFNFQDSIEDFLGILNKF